MLRKPFEIENGIEQKARLDRDEALSFEEALSGSEQETLERTGEVRANVWILVLLVGIGLVFTLGRLYYLSVVQHEHYLAMADENRLRIEYLPAPRGAVYDSRGKVLAGSRPSFELAASPLDLPEDQSERERVIAQTAEIVNVPADQIRAAIDVGFETAFQSILIKQNIDRSSALVLLEQARELPGFRVVNTPIRDYYNAEAYAHLLGYVGKIDRAEYEAKRDEGYLFNDTIGKTGIELTYEQFLRGAFGQRQVEVDARGVVKKIYGEKDPVPGQNLVLNIESGLQDAIYNKLSEALRGIGRQKAAVIAMDPRDGRVLAFVSLPGFDNNRFAEGVSGTEYGRLSQDRDQPLFNRAIKGAYPPGSTVKPMVALAALEEEVVGELTVIEDRGYIVIENIYGGPDSFFYGFNRRALGPIRVKEAIARSSDIYFYVAGGGYKDAGIERGLGISRLAQYYNQFKLGENLGIDLSGARAGLVPTPEWKQNLYPDDPEKARWYLGNTYHAAIGQGDVLATPLHVLSWTSAIANNGLIMKPFIAGRVEDDKGSVIEEFKPEELGRVDAKQRYFDIVKEGMRMTVTEGTARSLNSLSIEAAGKTGSAQFDPSDPNRSHAWFTGYAPYEDPEIAIVVLIEDGGLGANIAVPVAREGFLWWYENKINND